MVATGGGHNYALSGSAFPPPPPLLFLKFSTIHVVQIEANSSPGVWD